MLLLGDRVRGKQKQGRQRRIKKLDIALRRLTWYKLSTINWRSTLVFAPGIYIHDWKYRTYTAIFTPQEFIYRIAIIFISGGAFSLGIEQCIKSFFRG